MIFICTGKFFLTTLARRAMMVRRATLLWIPTPADQRRDKRDWNVLKDDTKTRTNDDIPRCWVHHRFLLLMSLYSVVHSLCSVLWILAPPGFPWSLTVQNLVYLLTLSSCLVSALLCSPLHVTLIYFSLAHPPLHKFCPHVTSAFMYSLFAFLYTIISNNCIFFWLAIQMVWSECNASEA